MNKHVNKLGKEASDARRMLEESDSDSDDSDDDNDKAGGGAGKRNSNGARSGGNAGSGEKPSEEQVERLEEKLEAAQADQKNLLLIILQVDWS